MKLSTELAELRRSYSQKELSENSVSSNPFQQFAKWMADVLGSEILDANAMTLSTTDADCRPSSRVVLLRAFDADGFVFFTNYESRKGNELAANPNAALNFFWPELERQVNISGTAARVSREQSQAYFCTRPLESRVAAWASQQSSEITSRQQLEERFAEMKAAYSDGEVPCPPHWGGFRVKPDRFEFWQGRESRLHDRICYTLDAGSWQISRLAP